MSEIEILPGAEPFSAVGGPHGALVLHGFTGCPQSVRGLAQALAAAGFTVELPRLPGHGTSVEDLATTRWSDWSDAAEAAYRELRARCETVLVAGLSMGGALALWLAIRHPEIAGVAAVNPVVAPPDPSPAEALRAQLQNGVRVLPGLAGDIADPEAEELGYDTVPTACLISLFEGLDEVGPRLSEIRRPVLILNSPKDHVVQPSQSELAAAAIAGPVERVALERSYHVATLDYDRDEIERRVVEFALRVCTSAGRRVYDERDEAARILRLPPTSGGTIVNRPPEAIPPESRAERTARPAPEPESTPAARPGSTASAAPRTTPSPAGSQSRALVPASAPRPGRFGRWIQRVTGLVRAAPVASGVRPELLERIRKLEDRLAAHEEQTTKRLAEGEARVLHLLEQRLERVEQELAASLREIAAREVEQGVAWLRARLLVVAALALAAGAASALALARVFGAGVG